MKIVCLCGSTRSYEAFQKANCEETMADNIVLSVGCFSRDTTPEQKAALDGLHFRKIAMSDEVLILNVGGYIGESTRNEIAYAHSLGKKIRYLEP